MEDKEKTQVKHLEMKNIISEMKNTRARITSALNSTEEKMSELEDIAIETTQNKTNREKDWRKKDKASV